MLLEKVIFNLLAFSLFIIIFFKIIRRNDTNYIFNKIEITQTNLYDLVHAIGISLISTLTKTSNSFLKNNELKMTERFIKVPINYKLSNKYEYTEKDLPKSLTMNEKYDLLRKMLF